MNQGAKRHAHSERGADLYESPGVAPAALLLHEPLLAGVAHVWEPCAGRGAIKRVLEAAGKRVLAQDLIAYEGADAGIDTPVDFFKTQQRPSICNLIVTNPPFMFADDFIRHGLSLGCDVIVLLRLMALEGAKRSDLIDGHLLRVWAGIERLPMMRREGWTGPKIKGGNSGAPFAWFVFSAAKRQTEAVEFRRMSWRVPVPTKEADLFGGTDLFT